MVDAVHLPDYVEKGFEGGPKFQTTIYVGVSGKESRNIDWQQRRAEYNFDYGLAEIDYIEPIALMFHSQRGRAHAFLFKDWTDYSGSGEIGGGDGVETDFQLIKVYQTIARSYTRTITQPVPDTIAVTLDGAPTTAWTLQPGGIIRFTSAPGASVVVAASFEFDVPVRFDIDVLQVQMETATAGRISGVKLVEVLE